MSYNSNEYVDLSTLRFDSVWINVTLKHLSKQTMAQISINDYKYSDISLINIKTDQNMKREDCPSKELLKRAYMTEGLMPSSIQDYATP